MRSGRASLPRTVKMAIGLGSMAFFGAVITAARNAAVGLTWLDVFIGPVVLAGLYLVAQTMARKSGVTGWLASMIDAMYLLLTWAWLLQGRVDPSSARFSLLWSVLGTGALGLGFQIGRRLPSLQDRQLRLLAVGSATASVIAMVLTALLGSATLGSTITIRIAGFTMQPGEFARIGLVFAAAYLVSLVQPYVDPGRRSLRPLAILTGFVLIALFLQRDLSPAVLLLVVFSAMVWLQHGRRATPVLFVLGSVMSLIGLIGLIGLRATARGARFDQLLNPYDPPGSGPGLPSQLGQALLAYQRGGYFGRGWGLGFPETVPLSQSDYILTVAAEELGFVGLLVVLAGAVVLLVRGWRVVREARTPFTQLFAGGLVFMLAFSWLFTIAGTFGFIPHGGLAVPLLSRGGSSLLASATIVGLLIGIGHDASQGMPNSRMVRERTPADRAMLMAKFSGTLGVMVLAVSLLLPLPPFDRLPRVGHAPSSRIAEAQAVVTRGYEQASVERGRILAADGTTTLAVTWRPGNEACSAWNSGSDRPKRPRRCYPYGAEYSDVVGALAKVDPVAMEDYLAPVLTSCLDRGQGLTDLFERALIGRSCRRHADVTLTLDPELQGAAFRALEGQSGTVVVLEVGTGKVRALASTDAYDPEMLLPPVVDPPRSEAADPPDPPPDPRSLPRRTLLPAGSVIKLVTALAAAEAEGGQVAPVTREEAAAVALRNEPVCSGSLQDLIATSCNRGIAALARRTGTDSVDAVARDLGFGRRWVFDGLTMECSPLLLSDDETKECRNGDADSVDRRASGLAYVPVTPLQIALVGSAIADGGGWLEPQYIEDPSARARLGLGTVPTERRVVTRAAAQQVLLAMRQTTQPGGTAAGVFPGMDVAAKTGTPQRDLGGERIQDAWMLAIAPALEPRYVVVAWLSGVGSDEQLRGSKAGPVVQAVLEEALS
jgi:cell division protein FtsW (lipid II flippase)